MKRPLLLIALSICVSCFAQTTSVPDDNFETYLETHDASGNIVSVGDPTSMGNGTDGDDLVTTSAINTVTDLDISNLDIVDMTGIESFTALTLLYANDNLVESIDLSSNTLLEELRLGYNQLSTINLSNNLELIKLRVHDNLLSNIDVSSNIKLSDFRASNNQIESIDLSSNDLLTIISVVNNQLTSLNVKNGNNTSVVTFNTGTNNNLICITVDDDVYSTTNWTNIDAASSFSEDCSVTYVPDNNFETYLETHDASGNTVSVGDANSMGNGTANDDLVTTSAINTVTNLNVSFKAITDMTGIERFVSLKSLISSFNFFTTLDVSNLTQLETLIVQNGSLTELDVTTNVLLEDLNIPMNQITELNLSTNVELTSLKANHNLLTSLNLLSNTKLTLVHANDNSIDALNFRLNTLVTEVLAHNNVLTILDLKNGNNNAITTFQAYGNSSLTCINVDDANYSTTNWVLINGPTSFGEDCYGTYVPDDNFEQALIDLGHDSVLDNYVTTANINALTYIDVGSKNISDMTGIEDFVALTELRIFDNNISTIDVSTLIDLENYIGRDNNISFIDFSNNAKLKEVYAQDNNLISLDVSASTDMTTIFCYGNNITNVTIGTQPLLSFVSLYNNDLTSIDLSAYPALTTVRLENNDLSFLDIKNGNNTNINFFWADGNPSLTCINVDDDTYVGSNWNKDATATYGEHCYETNVPDDNFEIYLEANGMGNGVANDNYVTTSAINAVTTLDVNNQSITDMTGIEEFVSLINLSVQRNSFASIDVSNLTQLILLRANNCGLTTLDVTANVLLENLRINDNLLTGINLSFNPELEKLRINGNLLNTIDVSSNTKLTLLQLHSNSLMTIDLSNNGLLQTVKVQDNDLSYLNIKNGNNGIITTFDATVNSNLTCILVDNAAYSTTNWTSIDAQTGFNGVSCNVLVSPKVMLQGAALNPNTGEESLMRDDLRAASLLPTTSPYSDNATCVVTVFDDGGTSGTGLADDNIIDWIWVELRDETDNTIVIDSQSALLQRDGDVVDTDGISILNFNQSAGNYYIVIRHNNHLGIMTANTIALSDVTTSVDFTNGNNEITYGSNSQTTFGMQTDVVGMWTGNVNGDTVVQYSGTTPDVTDILATVLNDAGNFLNFPTYIVAGYKTDDANMDGNTQYSGTNPDTPFILQNVLAHPGNFLNFSTYQILEQLPENFNQ